MLLWAIPRVRLALSGRNSGKTPEALSERFLEFPSRVQLGCPKPYNSRHLRLPEHFQNYLPPSTAGGASFFRSGSGEGLPEPVMEFPAVLGVFLILEAQQRYFSYRAILVAIVSQNSFVHVLWDFAQLSRDTLQNGVSRGCVCVKLSTKGGIAPFWGSVRLP